MCPRRTLVQGLHDLHCYTDICMRLAAYRQFTCWDARETREEHQTCHSSMRSDSHQEQIPEESGIYTGYKESDSTAH
jgi:hypothetical protein